MMLSELVGDCPEITAVRDTIARLLRRHSGSRRPPPVLILGETGTGKGLVARELHRAGPRAAGPFVNVNCAAIPAALVEAEMLGFERGAFTDARHAKPGLFEAAHHGTIFLDEVGLLPEGIQGKLLKVIEEREVRRLGSTRSEPVDAWIVAATSEDLLAATREHRFRADLYHRMAVFTIWLPPLRERGRDVLLLAEDFLNRACAEYELPPKRLSDDARDALLEYPWPGNVRELANVMERVALLSEAPEVTVGTLGLPAAARLPEAPAPPAPPRLSDLEGEVERARLLEVMTRTRWNISRAAAALEVPRNTLRYRLEKHGLRPSDARAGRRSLSLGSAGTRPAPGSGVRWQRRRLSIIRAVLTVEFGAADSPAQANRPLDLLVEKLRSFGGRIEELGHRGVLAAFGVESVEDAPMRAGLAAMAIQRAATREIERFGVKLALHVGPVALGQLGDTTVLELEGKREAWALLDELLLRAEPDCVLVSGAAVPFLERRFDLTPVAPTFLGQPAYRLGRFEATGLRHGGRLALFVGRWTELTVLQRRLDAVRQGGGQVVSIAGDAGIGKSRLLYEFRQDLIRRGVRCLEGRCLSYAETVPYFPVLDLIRATCGLTDGDSSEAMSDKVRAALSVLGLDESTAAPVVLQLLDPGPLADGSPGLVPEQMKVRALEILREIVLRQSAQCPLAVIVEDLHWMDKTSEEYLASLVDAVGTASVLIVTTYRPGYRPPWTGKSYCTHLDLRPLALDDSRTLVRSVLRSAATERRLEELIVARGEGNPFFLEELARRMWELEQEGRELTHVVPETVEEVLLARTHRLSPAERSLLQEAAVIGRDVPLAFLQAVTDMPAEELRDGLATLRAGEFLLETGPGTEPGYTFKHALTHDVAYASLPPERCRALHARTLVALERLQGDRVAERVEEFAHHALRGDLREKAVEYLRQAGRKAAGRSALQDARARFEQALDVLETLPENPSTLEQAFEIRLELRPVLSLVGEVRQTLELMREAEVVAERLKDDRRRGRVCALVTNVHSQLAELDEAIVTGTRALQIAGRLGDASLRIPTTTYLEQAHYYRGEYQRVVDLAAGNLAALPAECVYEHFGLPAPASVYDRWLLVLSLAELGQFAEASRYEAELIRLAVPTQHAYTVFGAHFGAGRLHLIRGEWAEARSLLERASAALRHGKVVLPLPLGVASAAWALAQLGEASDALDRVQEGEELLERVAARGIVGFRGLVEHSLGRACLLLRRLDEAQRLAERAVQSCPSQPGFAAHGHHLLGDVATHPDRFEAARGEAHYRAGLALAERLGMRPLVAHCHLGLGRLYRRAGRSQPGRDHLTVAATMYRELRMAYWLEEAETDPGPL
jgi:transcriptional regulator with AAA-type ATPase domain/tetratricopeptide (TPR) repeat protein